MPCLQASAAAVTAEHHAKVRAIFPSLVQGHASKLRVACLFRGMRSCTPACPGSTSASWRRSGCPSNATPTSLRSWQRLHRDLYGICTPLTQSWHVCRSSRRLRRTMPSCRPPWWRRAPRPSSRRCSWSSCRPASARWTRWLSPRTWSSRQPTRASRTPWCALLVSFGAASRLGVVMVPRGGSATSTEACQITYALPAAACSVLSAFTGHLTLA